MWFEGSGETNLRHPAVCLKSDRLAMPKIPQPTSPVLAGALRHRSRPLRTHTPESREDGDGGLGILKWLIPSIGALCAIIGFVVESAHQSLLGLDFGDLGVRQYAWSAAQFFREILSSFLTAWFLPDFFVPAINSELILLTVSLLVLVVIALRNWLLLPSPLRSAKLALGVLILISGWSFWTVELPATRIENLLGRGANDIERTLKPRVHASDIELSLLARSAALYELIACERNSSKKNDELKLKCTTDRNYRTDAIKLFMISVGLGFSFAAIALMVWRRLDFPAVALVLAPLTFYQLLAPAYLYGKFIKPTIYDSVLVQLKTSVALVPKLPPSHKPKDTGQTSNDRLLTAIVLTKDDRLLTLYVNQLLECSGYQPIYEWVLWRIAIGEVVLVREIVSLDVLSERMKQVTCPRSEEPL